MDNSIPKIREGNEIDPFPQLGNGEGMKKYHSQISGRGREQIIDSHSSGIGIRGYHSQEYPGMGTGMKKHNMTIKEKYLANMWREKEFWPKHSQPHPPPFLIIPRLLVVVTATINEQKSKQNDLIHYN